jgi:hypothetical protein
LSDRYFVVVIVVVVVVVVVVVGKRCISGAEIKIKIKIIKSIPLVLK